jgi:hypothetical protein
MISKSNHAVVVAHAKTVRSSGLQSVAIFGAVASLFALLTGCTGTTSENPGKSTSKLTELNGVEYVCPDSCGGSSDVNFSNGKASVTCTDSSGKQQTCSPSSAKAPPAKSPPQQDPSPSAPQQEPQDQSAPGQDTWEDDATQKDSSGDGED